MAFSWLLNGKSVAELRVKDDGVITHSFTEQVVFFYKYGPNFCQDKP